jgi:hypothetical protein
MHIDPTYLEITFDGAGVRNSQKRLKDLIVDLAVEPLKEHHNALNHKFSLVEEILAKRIAYVITYWCQHKHEPTKPSSQDMMSSITNSSKNDVTLEEFYFDQIKNAMYLLAPLFGLDIPDTYEIDTEELEYALIELEDKFEAAPISDEANEADFDYSSNDLFEDDNVDETSYSIAEMMQEYANLAIVEEDLEEGEIETLQPKQKPVEIEYEVVEKDKAIVLSKQTAIQQNPQREVSVNVLNLSADKAWQLTYSMMGYPSEYIQQQMLPRWQQNPDNFDKDRRFLYQSFVEAIRNAAGAQLVAGNYVFVDRPMTIDQLWNYYFTDLSRNVGPILTTIRLQAQTNTPWYKRIWKTWFTEVSRISPVWLAALIIALVFDGLTTFVALDQTPMEGFLVWTFTILITILFQIADLLVISYRNREFEADGLVAKFKAQFERYSATLAELDTTSDSFVQVSTQKSKAQADYKAAQDTRQMSRRGRFWSARIADINVIVTAYGFSYMFLNAEEPMLALYQQIEVIRSGAWGFLNLWVFLMIGLAITVSFVINTAQRTEILGWSMRQLKNAD